MNCYVSSDVFNVKVKIQLNSRLQPSASRLASTGLNWPQPASTLQLTHKLLCSDVFKLRSSKWVQPYLATCQKEIFKNMWTARGRTHVMSKENIVKEIFQESRVFVILSGPVSTPESSSVHNRSPKSIKPNSKFLDLSLSTLVWFFEFFCGTPPSWSKLKGT